MPEPMNILLTADAFRVGGRETFIEVNLGELRSRVEGQCSLLTSEITGSGAARLFDHTLVVPALGPSGIAEWNEAGSRFAGKQDFDLVWGQHFRPLQSWIMAALLGKPFLPTFHSPVNSIGLPDDPLDLLGISIMLHRLPVLSAVSEEIAESLRQVSGRGLDVRVINNRVRIDDQARARKLPNKRTKLVLMTRRQKLGHIRAAVEFAAAWRLQVGPVELIIRSDMGSEQSEVDLRGMSAITATARILGRKWLLCDWKRSLGATLIRWEGVCDDPEAQAREADVMLGMGRALLEGLGAGRPGVLIGYDEVKALVDQSNFDQLACTNFSGRNCMAMPLKSVVGQAAAALQSDKGADEGVIAKIDLVNGWNNFWETLCDARRQNVPGAAEVAFAKNLLSKTKSADTNEFIDCTLPIMSDAERQTFAQLTR